MKSSAEFIQAVKDRIHAPEQQTSVDDTEILTFLNEELENTVWPFLCSLRKNWNVVKTVITLGATYPDNRVPIPHRAFASGVRELKYADTNGSDPYNLPEYQIEDLDQVRQASQSTKPLGYCIESDHIKLVGTDRQLTGDLHIWYVAKPSEVVSSPGFSVSVKLIDPATQLFTFDTDVDFASYIGAYPTSIYDVVRRSTGAILTIDQLGTKNLGSTALTFAGLTSDESQQISNSQNKGLIVTRPAYIDPDVYICRAGHTMYTPVPEAAETWLIAIVGARVLESIGDIEGMQVLLAKAAEAQSKMSKVMGVRNQGESKSFNSTRGLFGYVGYSSRYRR